MRTIPSLSDRDGWPEGPSRLVVVGPPGTGKTHAILDRFVFPALDAGVRVEDILVCSFTRAAAQELRTRVAQRFAFGHEELRRSFSTIHSRAWSVTGGATAIYQLGEGFRVVKKGADEWGAGEPFELEPSPGANPARDPMIAAFGVERTHAAIRVHDFMRHRGLEPEQIGAVVARVCPRFDAGAVERVIGRFEEMKQEHGACDFSDLLVWAVEGRGEAPQRAFVIVDEAQDLTPLMRRVVARWCEAADRAVFVGDPDQAIFGFAGADAGQYAVLARGAEIRQLTQSFRVPSSVHALARRVIILCKARVDAPYRPKASAGAIYCGGRGLALKRIAAAVREGRGVFVLARAGYVAEAWSYRLRKLGIPHHVQTSTRSATAGVGAERSAIRRALRAIVDLRREREPTAGDLVALVKVLPVRRTAARFFLERRRVELPPGEIASIQAFEERGVCFDPLRRAGTLVHAAQRARLPLALIAKDLDVLERFGRPALADAPSVLVTTLHRCKGRQAEVVVLDLALPKSVGRHLTLPDGTRDEELRLLYVGVTRALDELILVDGQYARAFSEVRWDQGAVRI